MRCDSGWYSVGSTPWSLSGVAAPLALLPQYTCSGETSQKFHGDRVACEQRGNGAA